MKSKRMSPTRKRFLLSYILFAVVFALSYIPVYSHVHNVVYMNVCKSADNLISHALTKLDASVDVALNTYTATKNDSRFLPIQYTKMDEASISPVELHHMRDMMRYAVLPGRQIEETGLLHTASSFAVTNKKIFLSDVYYSLYPDFLRCGEMDITAWKAMLLESGTQGAWLPEMQYWNYDHNTFNAIAYSRVWASNASDSDALIYYSLINVDEIVDKINHEGMLDGGYLIIRDAGGNEIVNRGEALSDQYEVRSFRSGETGMEIEVGLSAEYLYHQLEPLEQMIFLYIAILLATMGVLVLVFSHHSAAPMKKLISAVEQTGMVPTEAGRHFAGNLRQDYEKVATGIHQLSDRLKSNAQIIQEQTERLREHLFNRALQRSLYKPRDQQDFHRLFSDFPKPFCLAAIRCNKEKYSVDERAHITMEMLQSAYVVLDQIYYASVMSNGMLLMVLPSCQAEDLEKLCQKLLEESGISVHGLLSQSYLDSLELSDAYDQIQNMELMANEDSVITHEAFHTSEEKHVSMPLTFSALHEMYEALATGDETLARIILNDCVETVLCSPEQLMVARHTHAMICHMLAQLKMEYPTALFSVRIPLFEGADLEKIFRQDLPACIHQISQSLVEVQSEKEDLPTAVLCFISDHLFSNELCVTYVADHFGIAKATLQRIIKEATDTTFSAYVGTQRLERAYRLMKESGMSVQKVSEMCGFSSTNSFYKAFRRKYGVAPSSVISGVEEDEGEA